MKHLISILILTLSVIMAFACGGRTAGGDGNDNLNNNNENVNQNNNLNNNNQPPELLTRRIILQNTLNVLLGYQLDLGPNCVSLATDVHPEEGLQEQLLCWALDFGKKLKVMLPYPDGKFLPEYPINHAEMWAVVDRALGFSLFPGQNPAPDIEGDSWYALYAASLWDKGLLVLDDDGLAHPSDRVTMSEWYNLIAAFKNYLDQPPHRRHVIEAIAAKFFYSQYSEIPCVSDFYDDVTDGTLICYTSDLLVEEGLLNTDQELMPDESYTWAVIAKISVYASGVDPVNTGCSGTQGHWGEAYMDALCELGILPASFSANIPPLTLKELLRFMSDLEIAIYVPPVPPTN